MKTKPSLNSNNSHYSTDLIRASLPLLAALAGMLGGTGCSHTRELGWTTMDTAFNVHTEKALIEKYKNLPGYVAANYTGKAGRGASTGITHATPQPEPLSEKEKLLSEAAKEVNAQEDSARAARETLRDEETNRIKDGAKVQDAKERVKAAEKKLALARQKQNDLLQAMGRTTTGGKQPDLLPPKDASVHNLTAKELRNKIMNDLMWLVDADYYRTKQKLYKSRAHFGIVTDWMIMGTSAAGTLAGGEAIKTILAATSGGIVGARNSVNENLFRQKATEAIISQMDALRDKAKGKILPMMESDVDKYSLEAGLADIHEYYSKGNEVAAITALYDGVVPLAQQAKANLDDIKTALAGKPEAALRGLMAQVAAKKTPAELTTTAQKIWTAMGDETVFKTPPVEADQAALAKLQGAVNEYLTKNNADAEKLKAAYERLIGAFNAALK